MLVRACFDAFAAGVPLRGQSDVGDFHPSSTRQGIDGGHGGVFRQSTGQIYGRPLRVGKPDIAFHADFVIVDDVRPRDDAPGRPPIGVQNVGG